MAKKIDAWKQEVVDVIKPRVEHAYDNPLCYWKTKLPMMTGDQVPVTVPTTTMSTVFQHEPYRSDAEWSDLRNKYAEGAAFKSREYAGIWLRSLITHLEGGSPETTKD